MTTAQALALTWFVFSAQVVGLLAALVTRGSEGSRYQTWCRYVFVASLVLVGSATILASTLGPGCWLSSGATFSVMVVAGTCEFSRQMSLGA